LPKFVVNMELPKHLSSVTELQEHFQHQRKLSELCAEDGAVLATMLLIEKKNVSKAERVEQFVGKNSALQELKGGDFPQISQILKSSLENKFLDLGACLDEFDNLEPLLTKHSFLQPMIEGLIQSRFTSKRIQSSRRLSIDSSADWKTTKFYQQNSNGENGERLTLMAEFYLPNPTPKEVLYHAYRPPPEEEDFTDVEIYR